MFSNLLQEVLSEMKLKHPARLFVLKCLDMSFRDNKRLDSEYKQN